MANNLGSAAQRQQITEFVANYGFGPGLEAALMAHYEPVLVDVTSFETIEVTGVATIEGTTFDGETYLLESIDTTKLRATDAVRSCHGKTVAQALRYLRPFSADRAKLS